MLLVAITGPPEPGGGEAVVVGVSVFRDVVDPTAVEPDSWLALGVPDMLKVLFNLAATPSMVAWKTGAVFVRRRGAWAIIRSPFANR